MDIYLIQLGRTSAVLGQMIMCENDFYIESPNESEAKEILKRFFEKNNLTWHIDQEFFITKTFKTTEEIPEGDIVSGKAVEFYYDNNLTNPSDI